VDDSRNISQDGQQDVDEEVCSTTALKEDSQRWQKNSQDDLADVGSCERHVDGFCCWMKYCVGFEVW
jgi:hypothetical protein